MGKHKRVRCRNCGELGFIKARDPQTNIKKMFVARRDPITRELLPDFAKPHAGCQARGTVPESQIRQMVERLIDERMVEQQISGVGKTEIAGQSLADVTMASQYIDSKMGVMERSVRSALAATDEKIKALADRQPLVERITMIVRPNGSELRLVGHHHPLFGRLLRYVQAGVHVYLYGAPGGGKSTAARQVADALERRFGYMSLAPMTPESRLMGFLNASGVFCDTQFYDCYVNGGVFCLDEADNANDALLTALNGALENGTASFPNGLARAHEDFVLVATGNTAGYGGTRGHAGRRAFDNATRERFAYIPWIYDEPFEEKLTLAVLPSADVWLQWVRTVRKFASTNHPDLVVSPRASIRGAQLLRDRAVESLDELAEAVLFKGLEQVQRAKILAACPLPQISTEL